MAELTITIDDDVLEQARTQALRDGTSVEALLRDYLENYTHLQSRYRNAAANIIRIAGQSTASSKGTLWTQDKRYKC